MSAVKEECDVVVVGGGPVGLTTAAALNHFGIKTTLIEKERTISPLAKAQFVSGRSMEHFQQIGLEKLIQNAAWPRDQGLTITFCNQLINGNRYVKFKVSSWGDIVDQKPGARFLFFQSGTSISAPLFCPQTDLESTLRQHLEGCKNASLLWGWEVTNLKQDATGAMVTLTNDEGDEKVEKCIHAKFVVACDGGKSRLRKLLNVHTYGKFVFARAVSIMFKSNSLFTRLGGASGRGFNMFNNGEFSGVILNSKADDDYIVHIAMPRDTTDEEIEAIVQNPSHYIDTILGEKIEHTVIMLSEYNMHGLISTKFCVGQCFFAGDSAHQWVPNGGFGMNTGIGDAFNLTWKIAAVLKGYGGPQLLDSYEIERKPACDATRRFALSLATLFNFGSKSKLFKFLAVMPLPLSHLQSLTSPLLNYRMDVGQRYVFGLQYSDSNVVVHEYDPFGNQRNIKEKGKFVPESLPGCRAPHIALPDCISILDLFGKSFVLLIINGQKTDCKQLRDELENRSVPLSVHSFTELPELSTLYDRKYFLIRPDGMICWRSDVQPSTREARRIVSVVMGDCPRKRFLPIKPPTPSSYASFCFDAMIAAGIGGLLHKYTDLDFKATMGAGLGLFWFLRRCKTFPVVQYHESTGRHKAAVIKNFGESEDVFEIDPKYTHRFGPNEILVRVHAVSVNQIDVKIRRGYIASLFQRLARFKGRPVFPILLGRDCSGEVVAVGDNVTKFVTGDEVYALSGYLGGTYAQLATVPEESTALKPQSIDHKEAASIAYVAATAYTALVENVGLSRANTRGKKVLVHGGTGGVGSFAVQLLKAWGAKVTVTCSAENIPLARSLGADKAIDYKQQDFSRVNQRYDIVFDTIGGSDYESRSLRVLKAYGGASYVSIVTPKISFLSNFPPILGDVLYLWYYRFKIILNRVWGGRAFYYSITNISSNPLELAAQMVEKGEIKPVIDAVYSLDEIIAAHQHVEEGHTRGKVVVTMP